MNCNVKPYEGKEPFVFFSYCRQNGDVVYPIIEELARNGYRVWYDIGIHPGADWTEVIADHITRCSVCVAAVTKEFAGSHNCRNEMNFVIAQKQAGFIPILMDDFAMTAGMALMLSGSQYIKKYEFAQESAFFARLFASDDLNKCKGTVSLLEQRWTPPAEPADRARQGEDERRRQEEDERRRREEDKRRRQEEDERRRQEEDERRRQEEDERRRQEEDEQPAGNGCEECTQLEALEDVDPPTVLMDQEDFQNGTGAPVAVLICLSDKKVFELSGKTTRIGRNAGSDIVLQAMTVGSFHATIGRDLNGFYLRDEDTKNGTWLNGEKLEGMKPTYLGTFAQIAFASEEFVFVSGKAAERLRERGWYAVLYCVETGEMLLVADDARLGRNYVWPKGTLSDKRTSRFHGTVICGDDGAVFAVDDEKTTNGTYLNGRRLAPGERAALKDNDEIRFGKNVYHIQFHVQTFRKGEAT